MRSQVEDYRAKAKECARLTVVTKSLREGRRYRKLAEMYWALALGEEIAQRSVFKDERDRHDHVSHGVSQTIREEVGTSC